MNIALTLMYMYPGTDPLKDFIVQDDGAGQYIKEWNLPDPQPTQKELEAKWPEAEAYWKRMSFKDLEMTVDKPEILANSTDTATITVKLIPAGTGITQIDVLLDGPPITEVDVIDDIATIEFTAIDPGKYLIETACNNVRRYVFVKAV